MKFLGNFFLINESRQSVIVQKPEMPPLKRFSEEFDEPDGLSAGVGGVRQGVNASYDELYDAWDEFGA
jgi:hypothetical protein